MNGCRERSPRATTALKPLGEVETRKARRAISDQQRAVELMQRAITGSKRGAKSKRRGRRIATDRRNVDRCERNPARLCGRHIDALHFAFHVGAATIVTSPVRSATSVGTRIVLVLMVAEEGNRMRMRRRPTVMLTSPTLRLRFSFRMHVM